MTEQRMTLADYVRELTETHSHVETYQTKSITGPGFVDARHITRVPALLAQLANNDIPSVAADEGARAGYASKPAARLEALDALVGIDLAVNRWIVDIGDQPHHLDTARALRQLHSIVGNADQVTRRAVEHDVRRWWTRARIVTGWDSPAWTPDNTCPSCGERGTLRVKEPIGMCTFKGDDRRDACGATWTRETIGLLADHVRAENEQKRVVQRVTGPCWCPYPEPSVPDLRHQCATCGSARCWYAVQARLLASLESTS